MIEDLKGVTVAKHYRLGELVATAGPWNLYTATNKKPGAVFTDACVSSLGPPSLRRLRPPARPQPRRLHGASRDPGAAALQVWIINKRGLYEGSQARGAKPKDFDEFFAQQRERPGRMAAWPAAWLAAWRR